MEVFASPKAYGQRPSSVDERGGRIDEFSFTQSFLQVFEGYLLFIKRVSALINRAVVVILINAF
tara:strand:+ start:563 stop:754 length:192 start_codon:yes stop_codon:yes gene_type:complete